MDRLGHTVIGLEPPQPQPADDTRWAHLLFKRVGPNRAGPVFRALSKCFHPDVGGDMALRRELNAAHAELSTRQRKESA